MSVDNLLTTVFQKFSGSNNAIGVDVGVSTIKIVHLKKESGTLYLDNYAIVESDRPFIDVKKPGVVSNFAGTAIKKALDSANIKGKKINIATPSFTSLIVTIEVSNMPENKFKEAIRREVAKYIPVNIDDVIYDWQIIDEDKLVKFNEQKKQGSDFQYLADDKNKKLKLLIIAITKDISRQYGKILSDNKLDLNLLEIDSISLARALNKNDDKISLILDIGHKSCNVLISSRDGILINRTIDVGGDKMTEVIQSSMKVDFARAEQLKKEHGLSLNISGQKEGVLLTVVSIMVEEIKKTLELFKGDFEGANVDEIFLTGGSSKMKGLKEFIKKEVGIPVFIANPLKGIYFKPEVKDDLIKNAPLLTIAIGLALANFDN